NQKQRLTQRPMVTWSSRLTPGPPLGRNAAFRVMLNGLPATCGGGHFITVALRRTREFIPTFPGRTGMNRREFLETGAAGLATSMVGAHVALAAQREPYRVGLIGCGWYGKSDLFRLIQVAPVEVVSLCEVDKHMLDGAAEMVSQRQ